MPANEMQQLLIIQEERAAKTDSHDKKIIKHMYSIATAFLLCIVTIYFIYTESVPVSQRIAAEVAYNHQKLKPLEVQSAQISGLKDYFTKLDFALIDSRLISADRWTLLGGRYCSIQGITAAQLRMIDKQTGEIQTLYEAEYEPKRHGDIPDLNQGQSPIQVYDKGVTSNIWVENGLLFVLTGKL